MSCPSLGHFVCGSIVADELPGIIPGDRPDSPPPIATGPLERLAQLMNFNDRLMEDLATSRRRIVRARAYLDGPGGHARFGLAHLERCHMKHSGILAQLRANRIEALHLLGEGVACG